MRVHGGINCKSHMPPYNLYEESGVVSLIPAAVGLGAAGSLGALPAWAHVGAESWECAHVDLICSVPVRRKKDGGPVQHRACCLRLFSPRRSLGHVPATESRDAGVTQAGAVSHTLPRSFPGDDGIALSLRHGFKKVRGLQE